MHRGHFAVDCAEIAGNAVRIAIDHVALETDHAVGRNLICGFARLNAGTDCFPECIQVIMHDQQLLSRAEYAIDRVSMAENEDGVVREHIVGALEHRHPIAGIGTGVEVDDGVTVIEDQISHVDHIGFLEVDDGISRRMGGTEVMQVYGVVADLL